MMTKLSPWRTRPKKQEGYESQPSHPIARALFFRAGFSWHRNILLRRSTVRPIGPAIRASRLKQGKLLFRQFGLVLIVSADDALHQMVTDDVAFIEVDERQSFDALQDVHGFQQAAAASIGQIDL